MRHDRHQNPIRHSAGSIVRITSSKLEYRGLDPRGTFVRGGRPKGRPYGTEGAVV